MQFQQIIGQKTAKLHLLETLRSGRFPHASLICGPAGVGKLATAIAIAQYMNCLQPTETDSCGKCSNCVKISHFVHPDLHFVLPIISKTEGGRQLLSDSFMESFGGKFMGNPYYTFEQWQQDLEGDNKQLFISVHEMREAKRKLLLKAFEAPFKTLIVWNADKMRVEGANAFLKLLEEPPEKTLIIMTCSDTSKLLTTINSRCQRFFLDRVASEDIAEYLVEKKELSASRAKDLALVADGSIGNVTQYLNEAYLEMNQLYINWLRECYRGNYHSIHLIVNQLCDKNKEYQRTFLKLAIGKLRISMMFHWHIEALALATQEEKEFHEKFSLLLSPEKVERMTDEIENAIRYLTGNANAEMTFVSLSLRLFGIMRG
ncbi:MAG: ATP-binding protein [Bacteroidia bacterium]